MQQVQSLSPGRARLIDSGTQTDSSIDQDGRTADSVLSPDQPSSIHQQQHFNTDIDQLQKELIAAISKSNIQKQEDAKNDDISPNGNNNSTKLPASVSHVPLMQRSYTPCNCEHCQLCPVAKTLARLTSSESGNTTADDNNKNLPPSMTTSDISLPALPETYSVEETLQTLKMINNNNQQEAAAAEIHELVIAQQMQQQYHSQPSNLQLNSHSQPFSQESEGDKWDAIEKVLSENIDLSYSGSPTSCKSRRKSNMKVPIGNHSHATANLERRGSATSNSSSQHESTNRRLRRQVLEGEKQHNYEQHHSFFVTQALQVGARRAQLIEALSDEEGDSREQAGLQPTELRRSLLSRHQDRLLQRRSRDAKELNDLSFPTDLRHDDEDENGDVDDSDEDEDYVDDDDEEDIENEEDIINQEEICHENEEAIGAEHGIDTDFDMIDRRGLRNDDVASSELDSSHEDEAVNEPHESGTRYDSMTRRK